MPKSRPRLKLLRRFGVQLPGLTRKSAEHKPYPPGQHGQSRSRRKQSEFRRLLEEKQKVRFNSIAPGRARERASIVESVERGPQLRLPTYIAMDPSDKFSGRIVGAPMPNDVPVPVNASAIVEFYAR